MRCSYCFFEHNAGSVCPACNFAAGGQPDELFYLFPGTQIGGRYVVGRTLGAGGFGIVYKAWDNALNKVVALKEYYPSGMVTRQPGSARIRLVAKAREAEFNAGRARFKSECAGTTQISETYPYNPAIVHEAHAFEDNDTSYLAMEYVEGPTLTAHVEKNGPMALEPAMGIMEAVLGALRDIHALGIVHRDISPDNIILTAGGGCKLIDFGAGRFGKSDKGVDAERIMKPGFSPPEQYEPGERSGVFTDIYSAGATMYFMLTGLKPDESTNRKDKDLLASPASLVETLPPHVSDAILKAMAIDFRLRYRGAAEFAQALRGETKAMRPEAELRARKLRRMASVAATFALLLTAGFFTNMAIQGRVDTLRDASFELWFALTGDEPLDAARQAAYAEAARGFGAYFGNIGIEVVGIPQAELAGRVAEAIAEGRPVLFESGGFGQDGLAGTLSLFSVADRARDGAHFMELYGAHVPAGNQFPIGFSTVGFFLNTELTAHDGRQVSQLAELGTNIAVDAASRDDFAALFGAAGAGGRDDFFAQAGGTGALFGSTALLREVQEAFVGGHLLAGVGLPAVPARLEGFLSAVDSPSASERAAMLRFLEYLLSEEAQNILHIQNQLGMLPLNKNELERFGAVFSVFDGFFDNFERFAVQ